METSLLSLSPRELRRLAVLERVVAGDLSQVAAARLLGRSPRQLKRLIAAFRHFGPASVASKRRGHPSNRAIAPAALASALELVARHYADFGPTLASEKLGERHGLVIDHETLRRAMMRAGLWKPRARRDRTPHLPRERRACFGELVQLDGSLHQWFEGRGPRCALHVAIDDATSALLGLWLAPSETTLGYFALLHAYLQRTGRPAALYTDRAGIFRTTLETATGEKTQFGRALDELDIELICANSPQAKGRVERVNATLQDRLVKELRLRNITSIEAANAFLPQFVLAHNTRFARAARSGFDAHRPLENVHDLDRILSLQHRRTVSSLGIISFENRHYVIDRSDFKRLSTRTVNVYFRRNGTITIEQAQRTLRFAETLNPIPRRPVVTDRADRHVPNPKKAHRPSAEHPWRKPFATTSAPSGGRL